MMNIQAVGASAMMYGSGEKISEYGIASVENALLAAGVTELRLELQILAAADTDKNHLYRVRNAAKKCCKAHGCSDASVEITRTAAVAQTSVLVNGSGIKEKERAEEAPRAGWDIVLTGYAGMEGTLRILDERSEELSRRFAEVFLDQIRERRASIFAGREILAARALGVSDIYQVGDGGIFAALYRLSEVTGAGVSVDLKAISIRQETVEICEYYRLNPYQLTSVGTMLMLCENGEALTEKLREEKIAATVIGQLTGDNDKVLHNGEDIRYIDRPAPDELMKIYP